MKKSIIRFAVWPFVILFTGGIFAGISDRKRQKTSKHKPYGIYEKYGKRSLDVILSGMALLFFWPLMIVTGVLVRINMGKGVIFKQQRPGRDGEIFTLYKFRSMSDRRDDSGKLLPDEARLGTFGKALRATSMDELPELWNILKGDMSIVGPRPLLVEYLPRYDKRQRHRHDVRPGLTGLAQVRGRNGISWDEKFENDVKYVSKITLPGDLNIIIETVAMVLRREGINSKTSATMEPFQGGKRTDR